MTKLQSRDPRRELYRVVVSYRYANGPLVVPSVPMAKAEALRLFAAHLKSDSYWPGSNRRVRVMSEAECERWGYR